MVGAAAIGPRCLAPDEVRGAVVGAAAIGPRCLAPDEVRGAVMGAAAIELRNCVVRKDYTVSYAAMTVYDGMTLFRLFRLLNRW